MRLCALLTLSSSRATRSCKWLYLSCLASRRAMSLRMPRSSPHTAPAANTMAAAFQSNSNSSGVIGRLLCFRHGFARLRVICPQRRGQGFYFTGLAFDIFTRAGVFRQHQLPHRTRQPGLHFQPTHLLLHRRLRQRRISHNDILTVPLLYMPVSLLVAIYCRLCIIAFIDYCSDFKHTYAPFPQAYHTVSE